MSSELMPKYKNANNADEICAAIYALLIDMDMVIIRNIFTYTAYSLFVGFIRFINIQKLTSLKNFIKKNIVLFVRLTAFYWLGY